MARMTKRIAGAITVAGASTALLLGTAATPAQAATIQGCPSGFVCLYPENKGWNNGTPMAWWARYDTYNLKGGVFVTGKHYVFNNQTSGAPVWFCTDSGGTQCPSYFPAGHHGYVDFTPIKSIKLVPRL